MYTFEQAQSLMQKYVDYQNNIFLWNQDLKTNIIILDEFTETRSFGWIFYWQEKNIKKDKSNFIIGNSPIIIENDTLQMYAMMTALTIEENVKNYLSDKNILAKLEIDEWGNFDVVNIEN